MRHKRIRKLAEPEGLRSLRQKQDEVSADQRREQYLEECCEAGFRPVPPQSFWALEARLGKYHGNAIERYGAVAPKEVPEQVLPPSDDDLHFRPKGRVVFRNGSELWARWICKKLASLTGKCFGITNIREPGEADCFEVRPTGLHSKRLEENLYNLASALYDVAVTLAVEQKAGGHER